MKLNDFLSSNQMTMASFANAVGTTTATISRVADGHVMPRKSLLERIHKETGGLVTPNDLAGLYCREPCHHMAKPARGTRAESDTDGE